MNDFDADMAQMRDMLDTLTSVKWPVDLARRTRDMLDTLTSVQLPVDLPHPRKENGNAVHE